MQLVVVGLDGLQVKIPQSVNLQLEGQGWLQMTVNPVLTELTKEKTGIHHIVKNLAGSR